MRVAPRHDGGWEVREPGRARPLASAASEEAALERARGLMVQGGVVQILDRDGFLVATQRVPAPADQPWWYVPRRRLAWSLAVILLAQGVLRLALEHDLAMVALGWLMIAVAVTYLVQLVLSRRRDRRAARTSSEAC